MDNFTQTIKKCPFVLCIVISVIIVSLIGLIGVLAGKFDARPSFQQPFTAIVLNGSAEKWAAPDEYEEGIIVQTTTHHYLEVEDAWFQDALIIGDTAVEELRAYGGLDTATYAYHQELNAENVFEKELTVATSEGSQDIALEELLHANAYSKIYIMVGANDLQANEPERFRESYETMIQDISRLQPDTTLFLLSIPAVTASCSEAGELYQNNMIYAYNYQIKELTDGEHSLYFNLNQVCCDSTGALKETYTTDGIHLRAEYYPLWADYIKEHGIE